MSLSSVTRTCTRFSILMGDIKYAELIGIYGEKIKAALKETILPFVTVRVFLILWVSISSSTPVDHISDIKTKKSDFFEMRG